MGCRKLSYYQSFKEGAKEKTPSFLHVVWRKNGEQVKKLYNYYTGGSIMPGRNFNSPDYRYGFGGHEKDDEIKGSGNHYSFGDYGYDPRLIRRWNRDPKANKYPMLSPYSYSNNNPILFVDRDGNDFDIAIVDKDGNASQALIALVNNLGLHLTAAMDANFVAVAQPPCVGCAAINLYPNIYYDNEVGVKSFKSTESQVRLAAHEISHYDELYVMNKMAGIGGVGAWYINYLVESYEEGYLGVQTEQYAYNYEDLVSLYLHREFEGEKDYILNLFENKDLSDEERARSINTAFAFWEQEEGPIVKFNQSGNDENKPVNGKVQYVDRETGERTTNDNGTPVKQ